MTITERLMKPGSFSVRLREDYPWSKAAAVDVFDHIVITPTRLDPIGGFSDANILSAAIYTGVITSKPSPRIFEGAGLAWWMGTDAGLGDLIDITGVSGSGSTLSTWITALRPASLSAGTVSNTGLGTMSAFFQLVTPREAIDAVCRTLGAEWRVNPSFTLDAAKSPDLFVSTPTTVVTRKEEGQDGGYRGLEASLLVSSKDVEQFTTAVTVIAAGAGGGVSTATSSGSTSYKDGLNGTVVLERLVNAPSDSSTNASAIAAAQVAVWNQVRRGLSLSSRTYTVTRFVRPGDYVYAYDQLAELSDAANQIAYRGEIITPIKLRVYALTWPVERGMGVYGRRSGATPTYTDLTDYVEWEDGADVVWDVGTSARAANDTDAATAGATAYLGANADAAARVSLPGQIDVVTSNTADTGIGTSYSNLANLALTVTLDAARQYRISAQVDVRQRTSAGAVTLQLYDVTASASIRETPVTLSTDAYAPMALTCVGWSPPSSGSRQIRVRCKTSANTVDTNALGGAFLQIEDMGLA